MQIRVTGKHMDVGQSLKNHVEEKLSQIAEKYFDNPIEAHVIFNKVAHHKISADVSVHVSRGILVQGHWEADDAYATFDAACDRIRKQLQRYKDRLKSHHHRMMEVEEQTQSLLAQQYIISGDTNEEEDVTEGTQPAIIAEMATNIETLSVQEAVMRLDLSNEPVIIFKNRSHGDLNVLYRRRDGNISWVDPKGFAKAVDPKPSARVVKKTKRSSS